MTSAEHLVIGSGAGGAITAALLAEAGRDVLILEEGPFVPAGAVEPFSLHQLAAQYRHGGLTAALGRPPVAYAEGRCVGGSTEVNAGLYHAPSEPTLGRWRAANDVDELTAGALAPYVAMVEEALSVQPLPHPAPEASQVLARGAEALGWPVREVPRWYRYDGGRAVKQSMTQTFLPRALAAGARLAADTYVRRLTLRGDRVAGAVTDRGLVTAEHVWVCAGAIGTAALLQRSGLGRDVGRTLSMHPTIKATARFAAGLDFGDDVPVHQVKPPDDRISIGGSASRPGYVALALADDWERNRDLAEEPGQLGVYYAAIRPEGRGRVIALPGLRDPLVTFALTRGDMDRLARGLELLTQLLLAAGADAVHPGVRGGGAVTRATASLVTLHLFSSVPFGEDARCRVDSFGRWKGVRALRVNDASLLPDAPGVNPQGTVSALAARNVAHFLA